jgi:hypothetical protein
MNKRLLAAASLAAFALLGAKVASAAPCTSLNDVDDSSPFCRNVEWLKNREITIGCDVNVYCPNDPVTRAAMALFLRRFGNVLNTHVAVASPTLVPSLNPTSTPVRICQAPPGLPLSKWPLVSHGYAIIEAYAMDGPVDFFGQFVESSDDGTTWAVVSPRQSVTAVNGIDSRASLKVLLPPRPLGLGKRYTYGVEIGRVAGSATTTAMIDIRCAITVLFENRNPDSAPFDRDD